MTRIILSLFGLFLAVGVMAQTSLQGKVTDVGSGEPIIFGNVALYQNGNLITGVETDFDGMVIRASAFTFPPYSIVDTETGNHEGFEYLIAAELAQSLNMKLLVQLPPNGEWWGRRIPGTRNYSGKDMTARAVQ